MTGEQEITREARLENLEALREFVLRACQECGADESACNALELAVDEATANLVMHGYDGLPPGEIRLIFSCDEHMAQVVIVDHGHAFSPDDVPEPDLTAGWEDVQVGGLGWHLIRQTMDEIYYQADPQAGNRLTLRRRLHSNGQ
jgi:serine/threonine-protein kinase RsbW